MAAFQDSKMNLTNFLAELASILRAKVIESSHEGNFFFFNFWALFSKCTFLRLRYFFLPSGYPINSIFPWQCIFIRSCFCGELSPINMHDTSMEWSCRVTWQIKYISTCGKCMLTKLAKVLTWCNRLPNMTFWYSDQHEVTWTFEKSISPHS